jgi:chromosome segregation ATPase
LDQIYKDWDKEDREIKSKFKEHCRAMQELETAELATQSQIDRLDKETSALERRQEELHKFIKNNVDTQSALASELAMMERRLDELLLAKESAAAHSQQMGQGQTDASQRRQEMYNEAQALDVQVDMLSQEMVDLVERLNRSTEQKTTADDTVAKVEKILNEQYKTLHWGTPCPREPMIASYATLSAAAIATPPCSFPAIASSMSTLLASAAPNIKHASRATVETEGEKLRYMLTELRAHMQN